MADFGSLYPEEMPAQQGQGPDPTADILRRLLFMQSADAGPQAKSWPQDLYTSRLRKVQQENPPPWQQEDMDTAVGLGMSMMPQSMIAKGVMAAPKIATAILGSGIGAGVASGMFGSTPANAAEDTDGVKQLQTKLRDDGYYSGAIDGKMGPATQRAQAAAQQAAQQDQQMELQRKQLELQQASLGAQTATSTAQQAETARLAEQERVRNQQREQGNKRFQEMEEDVPWYTKALRNYGPMIGYGAGAVAGGLSRGKVVSRSNVASREAADLGEEVMASAAKGFPARAVRANEFWRKGGANAEVPFLTTPGSEPGFAANANAAPINSLYPPPRARNLATDIGVPAGYLAESGASQAFLVPYAQERLQRAQSAASSDPSEINLQELQTAKNIVAMADTATNFGRTGAASYLGAAAMKQRSPSAPNFAPAEAERLAVEKWLRSKTPAASRQPQAPLPSAPPLTVDAVRARNGVPYGMLNVP